MRLVNISYPTRAHGIIVSCWRRTIDKIWKLEIFSNYLTRDWNLRSVCLEFVLKIGIGIFFIWSVGVFLKENKLNSGYDNIFQRRKEHLYTRKEPSLLLVYLHTWKCQGSLKCLRKQTRKVPLSLAVCYLFPATIKARVRVSAMSTFAVYLNLRNSISDTLWDVNRTITWLLEGIFNKLMSVFLHASVLLLIMNFVITLSK